MSKVIVYTVEPSTICPSGVAVIYPCSGHSVEFCMKDIPKDAIQYTIMDEKDLPTHREFRNVWTLKEDKKVDVDLPKAKELHKERLRKLRKPKLEALDVEFMRAVEGGDTAKQDEIKKKKQALRDITKHEMVVNASTPEELLIAIPDELK